MSGEPAGNLDSLLAGVSGLLEENPDLKNLAASLSASDLSPLLNLLGGAGGQSDKPAEREGPGSAGETAPAAVPQEKAGLQTPELQRAQALLQALRPFVNPERALLIDRAIRLLTTAGNVRAAMRAVGALNGLHTA